MSAQTGVDTSHLTGEPVNLLFGKFKIELTGEARDVKATKVYRTICQGD
jgi:hypothetical protein